MTAFVVAFLTLPLAALRPFQSAPAFGDVSPVSSGATISAPPAATVPMAAAAGSSTSEPLTTSSVWSCDTYRFKSTKSTSTHINHSDEGRNQKLEFVHSAPGKCVEAAIIGAAQFSSDESRITYLEPGGFARFRELVGSRERSVSVIPAASGSLAYSASLDGREVPFDADMRAWLARFLPDVLREAGINVPARVARLRANGGVPSVLREIGEIRSTGAKRSHYEELLKTTPLGANDASKVLNQAGQDLARSSGDLSAVIQKVPRGAVQNDASRQAIASAIARIQSSGDKRNTLEILAPNADSETLLMLAKAAEDIPSSGDKSNFLITTVSEYLTPNNQRLSEAFFLTAATVPSSGDLERVLTAALSYGHGNRPVVMHVIRTTKEIESSGDVSRVLQRLADQRLLTPQTPTATIAVIERTLTMGSSGDRSRVLMALANQGLLSTSAVREAYTNAALALPSSSDQANTLAAAARQYDRNNPAR